ARTAGLDSNGATLIRVGSNTLYRLPGDRVARIGPPGSQATAEREVGVSRWLTEAGVPTARALSDLPQPTLVDEHPVTWWEYVPDHRHGTTAELGALLRTLHNLTPPPSLELPQFDPFVGLDERIVAATHINHDDQKWLSERLGRLRDEYNRTQPTHTNRLVHGDAWQGNVAVPAYSAPLLLDLEHFSHGDPDWDLIPIAVDHTD